MIDATQRLVSTTQRLVSSTQRHGTVSVGAIFPVNIFVLGRGTTILSTQLGDTITVI